MTLYQLLFHKDCILLYTRNRQCNVFLHLYDILLQCVHIQHWFCKWQFSHRYQATRLTLLEKIPVQSIERFDLRVICFVWI